MTAGGLQDQRWEADHDRRVCAILIALGVIPTIWTTWILWIAPIDGLTADHTALAARDFTALWAAGRAAGEQAYSVLANPAGFTAYLRALFGSGMPFQIWPYPPLMLLLARPLAALPLPIGFVAYTGLTLAALGVLLRIAGASFPMTLAVLLSPAIACNALVGQNGALTAALLIGGLSMIDRRPIVAGLLLGALCIKPQLGLLVPVCLLASHRFRTLAAGCASAIFLTISSVLTFGYEPWVEFLTHNRTTVTNYAEAPWQAEPTQMFFSSVFMAARSVGAGLNTSYGLQIAAIWGCALMAWRLWANPAINPERRLAATLALVLLAAPWVHIYDLSALAVSIAILVRHSSGLKRVLLGFAWLWPAFYALAPASPLISVLSVASVAMIAGASPRLVLRSQHLAERSL